jgi:hypothetical protein
MPDRAGSGAGSKAMASPRPGFTPWPRAQRNRDALSRTRIPAFRKRMFPHGLVAKFPQARPRRPEPRAGSGACQNIVDLLFYARDAQLCERWDIMRIAKILVFSVLTMSLGLVGCASPKPPHLASGHKISGGSGSQQPGAAGAGDNNGPSGGAP